jgi:surface protein
MFNNAAAWNQDIGSWNTASITTMYRVTNMHQSKHVGCSTNTGGIGSPLSVVTTRSVPSGVPLSASGLRTMSGLFFGERAYLSIKQPLTAHDSLHP